MKRDAFNGMRMTRRRSALRAFTFIELIVAVALSVILVRGLYEMFASATALTRLSEEKTVQLLEVAALYDSLSGDLARVPMSGTRYFSAGGTSLVFRASPRSGSEDVYIKYDYNPGAERILRSVYREQTCTTAVDEDGDGNPDTSMAIAHKVKSFSIGYHVSGDIDGVWTASGTSTESRAVKLVAKIGTLMPGGTLPEETFTLIVPVVGL